jgi:hypothetical protein
MKVVVDCGKGNHVDLVELINEMKESNVMV